MDSIFSKESNQPMYIQLYNHFRSLILAGTLPSGSKLPSIRKCAAIYEVSKTTAEAAYVQLEAEGCIYSVAQSGFYVSQVSDFSSGTKKTFHPENSSQKNSIEFDFTSSAADEESFDFNLWQRYIKSALRTGSRLLDYGDPQGEEDLRKALCGYVLRSRGIVCNENQMVVGAGVQNLLQLLCVLEKERKNVLFLGMPYKKGETVFRDFGKNVEYSAQFAPLENNAEIIYTSPSHINHTGDVLNLTKRTGLLKIAGDSGSLIIEDDYDSEFSYTGHPVPALRSIDSGERVVYIGTFSKLLIPSIRISFMVLTPRLSEKYAQIRDNYNQTASKTEQIALCRYISDGHLYSRIKKTKKLYSEKARIFYSVLKNCKEFNVSLSQSGFFVSLIGESEKIENLKKALESENMKAAQAPCEYPGKSSLVFSVSSVSAEKIKISAERIVLLTENL